jgi:5'-nucleotidase
MIITAIPKYTKGKLAPLAKNRQGQPLASKVDALDDPRHSTAHLLAPRGTTLDASSVATGAGEGASTNNGAVREVKEWQAIMDHLCRLPVKNQGELPVIPVDERAAEVRAIKQA